MLRLRQGKIEETKGREIGELASGRGEQGSVKGEQGSVRGNATNRRGEQASGTEEMNKLIFQTCPPIGGDLISSKLKREAQHQRGQGSQNDLGGSILKSSQNEASTKEGSNPWTKNTKERRESLPQLRSYGSLALVSVSGSGIGSLLETGPVDSYRSPKKQLKLSVNDGSVRSGLSKNNQKNVTSTFPGSSIYSSSLL